jgi:transcriptional regulator with XRE-family HTH domain
MASDAVTLRELRKAAGLTVVQIGKLVGCHPSLVTQYDDRREPRSRARTDVVYRIAEVLAQHLTWERALPWLLTMGVVPIPFRDPHAIELDWSAADPDLRQAMRLLAQQPKHQARIVAMLRKELARLRKAQDPPQSSASSAA